MFHHAWEEENLHNYIDADESVEFLQNLLVSIYETGNIDSLENNLEELCSAYSLDMPQGKPLIDKREGANVHHA